MAELISTILRDTPEPASGINPRLPHPLEGIVGRCLEKDPAKRFPSAVELRDELRELRRQLAGGTASESWTVSTAVLRPPRLRARYGTAALLAVLALVAAYAGMDWLTGSSPRESPAVAEPSGKSSVAVLHFENVAHDAEIDWLRAGLARWLVTALAQSPEIDVVAPDLVYRILHDLGAGDDDEPSSEILVALAERVDVDAVLQGSFVRVDEELRIDFQLREAASGEIVTDRIEGPFKELFAMVDVLSLAIRRHLEIPHRGPASVADITTSSVEAWRHYSEHLVLARLSKPREAIASLEKAVEFDPDFALALVALGNLHQSQGHATRSRDYKQHAFELVDRLPVDERVEIEGPYYGSRWATLGRAIEVYEKNLELYPDRHPWIHHNLARSYAFHERYKEAIGQFEKRIASVEIPPNDNTYFETANAHAALGKLEEGYPILSEFADRRPDNFWLSYVRGWYLTDWGKLAEAAEAFRRADQLSTGRLQVAAGRWRLRVLQEDWEEAQAEASAMAQDDDPYLRWRGAVSHARNLLFRGRSVEALEWLDRATGSYREPNGFTALARCWKAELLLARGEREKALQEAKLAQQNGREEWPQLRGLFLEALAQQELDRPALADSILEELRQRWESAPNRVEERQLLHLEGLLALARGQAKTAAEQLGKAASLLPARGIEFSWHVYPQHVPIFSALGEAALAAGLDLEALRALDRVTSSGSEHVERPVAYVRGFYFLGLLKKRRGETSEARSYFERFLKLWQDGDLDRERLREALDAVAPANDPPR